MASFFILCLVMSRDLRAPNPFPLMQAPKRQLPIVTSFVRRRRKGPLHFTSAFVSAPYAGRRTLNWHVRCWMELVAGCYEQVLFGFSVHPEPKASGDHEVRADLPRNRRRCGRGKGWSTHMTQVNTSPVVNTLSDPLEINWPVKLRKPKVAF